MSMDVIIFRPHHIQFYHLSEPVVANTKKSFKVLLNK